VEQGREEEEEGEEKKPQDGEPEQRHSKTAEPPLSEAARQEAAGPGLARCRCDRSDCSLKSGTQPLTQRPGNVSRAGVTRASPADLCAH